MTTDQCFKNYVEWLLPQLEKRYTVRAWNGRPFITICDDGIGIDAEFNQHLEKILGHEPPHTFGMHDGWKYQDIIIKECYFKLKKLHIL